MDEIYKIITAPSTSGVPSIINPALSCHPLENHLHDAGNHSIYSTFLPMAPILPSPLLSSQYRHTYNFPENGFAENRKHNARRLASHRADLEKLESLHRQTRELEARMQRNQQAIQLYQETRVGTLVSPSARPKPQASFTLGAIPKATRHLASRMVKTKGKQVEEIEMVEFKSHLRRGDELVVEHNALRHQHEEVKRQEAGCLRRLSETKRLEALYQKQLNDYEVNNPLLGAIQRVEDSKSLLHQMQFEKNSAAQRLRKSECELEHLQKKYAQTQNTYARTSFQGPQNTGRSAGNQTDSTLLQKERDCLLTDIHHEIELLQCEIHHRRTHRDYCNQQWIQAQQRTNQALAHRQTVQELLRRRSSDDLPPAEPGPAIAPACAQAGRADEKTLMATTPHDLQEEFHERTEPIKPQNHHPIAQSRLTVPHADADSAAALIPPFNELELGK
ncbi:hypothetical protein [Martelella alba]|uniref:Uncharacterized protein n=1 Tax=Martelella alba TaxID=2590451 RepID=A0ABY2SGF3_9HYPH|nr:hypothetical protein [Martelella alba]TKI03509.1 hypothetical protein FCN80_21275 [Martelella alba]